MLTLLLLGWLARASRWARVVRAPYIVAYAPQESSRRLRPHDGVLVER